MGDLNSALNTAFDEVASESAAAASTPSTPEAEPEVKAEPEKVEAAQLAPAQEEEPTGDVLLDKLTPDQIAELKKDPRLRAIYKGLMSSYTPKMQQFSEQARLWDSLNNPDTRAQAVAALARAVGLEIKPTDQPQRDQAAQVADSISSEWSNVVGPEAAQLLRPLIEKTALAAVQGTLAPVQQGVELLQRDAKFRQADAQITDFWSKAQEKGWERTPEIEARMAQIGTQMAPTRINPITGQLELAQFQTAAEGVKFLERCYRLATADTAEADTEKRILERMNKAAKSAEPGRGVTSTGREKRTNITKEMSLNEAMDEAFKEVVPGYGE